MAHTNFWISSAFKTAAGIRMNGHNRSNHIFEIVVSKYILKGPVDFDNEKWDEGMFLVWDGDDLWHLDLTLSIPDPSTIQSRDMISDDEFRYDEFGLSPILYSQITGAIVANL